jgi:hypothetical protein
MKQLIGALALLGAVATPSIVAAAQPQLTGSWEAARGADDERLYVVLGEGGKAEIVTEYAVSLPGAPDKRRVQTSTFGKWTQKGGDVVISYANTNIKDHLRYVAREPLAAVGLIGSAPALKPVGTVSERSQIGSEVLWKAPHDYRAKASPAGDPPADQQPPPAAAGPQPVR